MAIFAASDHRQFGNSLSQVPPPVRSIFLDHIADLRSRVGWLQSPSPQAHEFRNFLENNRSTNINIDYAKCAKIFSSAFFEKNFLKSLIVFYDLSRRYKNTFSKSPLVDIGAGAGPATYAWLTTSRIEPPSVSLFDKSAAQLTLAKEILSNVSIPLEFATAQFPVDMTFRNASICMSYLVCENEAQIQSTISDKTFFSINNVIIIDYPEVLERIEKISHEYKFSPILSSTKYALDNDLQNIIKQPSLNINYLLFIRGHR